MFAKKKKFSGEKMNWQNIETAPEDKTRILALSTTGRIYIIYFEGVWHNMPELDFTHWMPLPKPPEE